MYQLDTLSYQASPCLRRHTTRLGHVTVTIPIGTLTCFFLPGVIDESWTRPGHIPCQVLPENNYVLIKSYSRLILILLTGSKVILSRCGPFVLFFSGNASQTDPSPRVLPGHRQDTLAFLLFVVIPRYVYHLLGFRNLISVLKSIIQCFPAH